MFSWLSTPPSWLHLPKPSTARHVFYGLLLGFSLSITSTSIALYIQQRKQKRLESRFEPRPIELRSDEIVSGVTGLIGMSGRVPFTYSRDDVQFGVGNTPLVRINSLSDALGVEILGKAEVRLPATPVLSFCNLYITKYSS